jgi:hypothetical protein
MLLRSMEWVGLLGSGIPEAMTTDAEVASHKLVSERSAVGAFATCSAFRSWSARCRIPAVLACPFVAGCHTGWMSASTGSLCYIGAYTEPGRFTRDWPSAWPDLPLVGLERGKKAGSDWWSCGAS